MKVRFWLLVFFLLLTLTLSFAFNNLKASSEKSFEFLEKIDKILENQKEIDSKLLEVENLVRQIKIRIYRKTGF